MLDTLITSKTRVKLLMKFFMNPGTRAYLRELASEFGESTNSVRVELNRLSDAKLLTSESDGRTIKYKANIHHTLFDDIHNVVEKYMGIDQIIEKLIKKLGKIESAYLIGDYAQGIDSGLIDIVVLGNVNKFELDRIAEKTGHEISRKIRPLVLDKHELMKLWNQLDMGHALLIWGKMIKLKPKMK